MDYERLQHKKELFDQKEETISRELLEHMEQEFEDQLSMILWRYPVVH